MTTEPRYELSLNIKHEQSELFRLPLYWTDDLEEAIEWITNPPDNVVAKLKYSNILAITEKAPWFNIAKIAYGRTVVHNASRVVAFSRVNYGPEDEDDDEPLEIGVCTDDGTSVYIGNFHIRHLRVGEISVDWRSDKADWYGAWRGCSDPSRMIEIAWVSRVDSRSIMSLCVAFLRSAMSGVSDCDTTEIEEMLVTIDSWLLCETAVQELVSVRNRVKTNNMNDDEWHVGGFGPYKYVVNALKLATLEACYVAIKDSDPWRMMELIVDALLRASAVGQVERGGYYEFDDRQEAANTARDTFCDHIRANIKMPELLFACLTEEER